MIKKYLCFFLILMSSLVADDAVAPTTKKEVMPSLPHVWISEGLMYLKAREDQLECSTGNPHFSWDCGLKIEAGFQPKDWFFFLNWSYIQNTAHGEKNTNGVTGFFPIQSFSSLLPSAEVTSATMRWKLNTQMAEFGSMISWRPISWFILKNHFGLKLASLNQKIQVNYGGGVFSEGIDSIQMENNFLGLGPSVGVTPNISLPYGLSLLGDFSVSLFTSRLYVSQKETYLAESLFSHTQVMTKLRLSLDAKAAIAWQKELFYKALVISMQAGWEWHEFYHQNEMGHLQGNKNLILQGGFLSFSLGF